MKVVLHDKTRKRKRKKGLLSTLAESGFSSHLHLASRPTAHYNIT